MFENGLVAEIKYENDVQIVAINLGLKMDRTQRGMVT